MTHDMSCLIAEASVYKAAVEVTCVNNKNWGEDPLTFLLQCLLARRSLLIDLTVRASLEFLCLVQVAVEQYKEKDQDSTARRILELDKLVVSHARRSYAQLKREGLVPPDEARVLELTNQALSQSFHQLKAKIWNAQ